MPTGLIKLYASNEKLIVQKKYNSVANRLGIISSWERNYYSQYPDAIVQIFPHTQVHRVRKDGTNEGSQKVLSLSIKEATFTRPPASYDNHRSSYGLQNLP